MIGPPSADIQGEFTGGCTGNDGVREPVEIWTAAHVDEDFNIEQWGLDEEVAARRATRAVDFEAATRILNAMKG